MRRTLLICDYPPASYAGGPIILRNLFAGYPTEDLFVAAPGYLNRVAERSGALECRYYDLPALDPATRYIGRFLKVLNVLLLPISVLRVRKIIREQRIDLLFTVPASTVALVAYLASRLAGVEMYVYVMDDYDESMRHQGFGFRLLNRMVGQKELVQSAAKVWAISKYMAEYFEQAYGVKAMALPHSVDLGEYATADRGENLHGGVIRLAHVGAIYGMQLDAVRNVVEMVQRHNRSGAAPRLELRLYIGLSDAALGKLGIRVGDGVVRDHVALEQMPHALERADILLLAYAFDPRQRQNVSTSLPTKTAEYLASGVPILVHAPPHATVSRYAREEDFGVVVDSVDPAALESAVVTLARDETLRQRLIRNGLSAARKFHDAQAVIPEFLRNFQGGSVSVSADRFTSEQARA